MSKVSSIIMQVSRLIEMPELNSDIKDGLHRNQKAIRARATWLTRSGEQTFSTRRLSCALLQGYLDEYGQDCALATSSEVQLELQEFRRD